MKVYSGKLAAACAVLALAPAGCGGSGDDGKTAGSDRLKGPSADKVAAQFGKVSGAALVRAGADTPDWTLLSLPEGTDRRTRDAPSVCNRITDGQLQRFGGLDSCRRGAIMRDAYAARLPASIRGLRFTAAVTGARATVFVVGPRFSGLVGLVKQGDTWRVNRVAGRKHRARGSNRGGTRS